MRWSFSAMLAVATMVLIAPPTVLSQEAAQEPGFRDELLDHLIGNWLMTGTVAGEEIHHDVIAEWVLDHQYLRLHEVAREKDERGGPAYEALIFIGWDEPSSRYVCLWLDSTGGSGLKGEGLGYAPRDGDEIAWVFDTPDILIHNTFTYRRDNNTWQWVIDTGNAEDLSPFARLALTRK